MHGIDVAKFIQLGSEVWREREKKHHREHDYHLTICYALSLRFALLKAFYYASFSIQWCL